MDIAEFLLARIADDEAGARAATAGPWEFADVSDGWDGRTLALETVAKLPPHPDGSVSPVGHVLSGWGYDASGISVSDEDAAHIARWDPARVLAECEAKRAIIETRQFVDAHIRQIALARPDEARDARATRVGLDAAITALALPYADHPDYDPGWKP